MHHPMMSQADTAWILLFHLCLGYTFTPATLLLASHGPRCPRHAQQVLTLKPPAFSISYNIGHLFSIRTTNFHSFFMSLSVIEVWEMKNILKMSLELTLAKITAHLPCLLPRHPKKQG
jgi:hypothetical protein